MLQAPTTTSAADDGLIKDTTTQTFMKDVIEESKRQPVLVDFWADWCNPCKQLTPVLEKVVKAAKGKIKLVKLNTDKHPAIPGQLGIQSLPTVFAFVNGQPAGKPGRRVPGARDQGQDRRRGERSADGRGCGPCQGRCCKCGRALCPCA